MTNVPDLTEELTESRRSLMKKGALATGALALGSNAAFGTATAGGGDQQVAVFSFRFYPGADFDVVAQLETSTAVEVLQVDGETVPEISQPDEWNGHIIRYDIGQDSGITTFLFMRGQSMSAGDSGTMGEDASMLSTQLNLLNTSTDGGGGTGGGQQDDDTPEDEDTPAADDNETAADTDDETAVEEDNVTAAGPANETNGGD